MVDDQSQSGLAGDPILGIFGRKNDGRSSRKGVIFVSCYDGIMSLRIGTYAPIDCSTWFRKDISDGTDQLPPIDQGTGAIGRFD